MPVRWLVLACMTLGSLLTAQQPLKKPKPVTKVVDSRTLRPQQAVGDENRIALVIGNDTYQNVPSLRNARSDARAIAQGLEKTGFKVTLKLDVIEKEMKECLRAFKAQIHGGDVAVFFFSGHGVQLGGANYLLPTDVRSDNEDQVKDESIPLQRILDDLEGQKAKFSLAIVDACRNNPFKQAGRAIGGRGLTVTTAATGQMILYSAGAGQEALDSLGSGDRNPNGLFTRVLLKEMVRPGIPVDRVLRNVREEVVKQARSVNHEQVPALYDQALGEFYFVPENVAAPAAPASIPILMEPAPAAPIMLGNLQVSVNVPDAKIYLDGNFKGMASPTAALNMKDLPVGKILVKAEAPGFKASQQDCTIDPGKWIQIVMVMEKQAPVPVLTPGPVSINRLGMVFVPIPPGTFTMGSDSGDERERPSHEVRITRPFFMQQTAVTMEQFQSFKGYRTNAETSKKGAYVWTGNTWERRASANWRNPGFTQEARCPVVCVSWNDAQAFITWLNQQDPGKGYRLPTEAEWEYACRAGTSEPRYGDWEAIAWHKGNSQSRSHPVGQKQPNAFGLFDMNGNAFQWCQDSFEENYYSASPAADPQGPPANPMKVMRGGNWCSLATDCRSAFRYRKDAGHANSGLGFRVVCALAPGR